MIKRIAARFILMVGNGMLLTSGNFDPRGPGMPGIWPFNRERWWDRV